jgi:putative transposase
MVNLAVVLDLFSRTVVEWSIATIYDANLIVQALQLSLTRRSPQAVLLHHSGRMSTYQSENYQTLV